MGDVDERGLQVAVQLLQLDTRLAAQLGVEVGKRLIEEEDLRAAHDGAAQGHALALAAREGARLALQEVVESEDARGVAHPRVDLGLLHVLHLQRESHVVVDGHVRVERVGLENHRDVAVFGRDVVHHAVADQDPALADLLEAGQHAKGRRLPATGRADQDHEFLVLDLDVEVFDDGDVRGVTLHYMVVCDRCHLLLSYPLTEPARMPRTK